MSGPFVLLTLVYLLALALRITYDRLKQRGRVDPQRHVVFWFVFFDMCLLWATWFGLCEQDRSALGLPIAWRQIGLGFTVLGGLLFLGALAQLRALENTRHLVTSGLFRWLRHPIYTGFACWYLGWPIYHDGQWSFILGVLSLGAIAWWRRSEERALLRQFGQAYRDYRDRTWF